MWKLQFRFLAIGNTCSKTKTVAGFSMSTLYIRFQFIPILLIITFLSLLQNKYLNNFYFKTLLQILKMPSRQANCMNFREILEKYDGENKIINMYFLYQMKTFYIMLK